MQQRGKEKKERKEDEERREMSIYNLCRTYYYTTCCDGAS